MEKLHIKGATYGKEIIEHTLKCLSDTLSPVGKPAIAKSFLKRFLSADNEHTLSEHFTAESEAESVNIPTHANVVQVLNYHFSEDGTGMVRDYDADQTVIAVTTEGTNKALRDLFLSNYPDADNIDFLVESTLIQGWLDYHFEGDERDEMEEKLLGMTTYEMPDWLVDNLKIDDLVDDDFFKDFLWMGQKEITYEWSEIIG